MNSWKARLCDSRLVDGRSFNLSFHRIREIHLYRCPRLVKTEVRQVDLIPINGGLPPKTGPGSELV